MDALVQHSTDGRTSALGGVLRPFQEQGMAYALDKRRCFIADQMGLGKTCQALAAVEAAEAYPAVVICPATLKLNWKAEAEKWLPHRRVEVLNGIKPSFCDPHEIVIVNYDIVHAWADYLQPHSVILDESHYCKSTSARRTIASLRVAEKVPRDGLRLLLTGTPILNHTQELVAQLMILDRLAEFGGEFEFIRRYCKIKRFEVPTRYGPRKVEQFYGGQNVEELNRRLRETCLIRREKADVLSELPPKQRATLLISGDKSKMEEYRSAELNDPTIATLAVMRRLLGEAKVPACVEWLKNATEPVVVWCHHRAVGEALASELDAPAIRGGMKDHEKQAAVDAFQAGRARHIVCSIQAAGVGLTLTAASDELFVEQAWTPALLEQAEDRCHRIGQQNAVTCWYASVPGTIDEYVFKLLRRKKDVVQGVTEARFALELLKEVRRG